MHVNSIKLFWMILLLCWPLWAVATETKYSIEYDPASPIKTVPLKEVILKIDLYQYSKPAGFTEVKTDQNQAFTLQEAYSLEIISIQDQDKFKAFCSGYAAEGEPKIIVTCESRK